MAEPEVSKVARLVPEVFYDIIARVIPGAAFLLGLCLLFGSDWAQNLTELELGGASFLLLTAICGGYVVGMLAGAVGVHLERSYRFCHWRSALKQAEPPVRKYVCDLVGQDQMALNGQISWTENKVVCLSHKRIDAIADTLHDHLKEQDDYARVLLPKLKAEAVMCSKFSVLFFGLSLVSVLQTWLSDRTFLDQLVPLIVVLLGTFMAYVAGRHRHVRLIAREFGFVRELIRPQNPEATA